MSKILKFPEIRKKLVVTLLIIIAFRFLAHIPVPGIDIESIRSYLQGNTIFGLFDLFSGGGFSNFSIVTLGVGPYINASIIIQLLTMMIPSLEELSKEGEYGREKINMYTKIASIPMSFVQSYGIYFLLSKQGIISSLNLFNLLLLVLTLVAGSTFLVWLGEITSEYGFGNGVSLLIFVSIISRLPSGLLNILASVSAGQLFNIGVFLILALLTIAGVVLINEGTRNLTIQYGRRGAQSQKVTNYLPIKVNQAGVIPIIFAVSIVSLPSMLGGPFMASDNLSLQKIGAFLLTSFNSNGVGYNLLYFLLVVGFTYFYTSVQFNSEKISEDIKKRGGFIPGVRPGKSTASHIKKIVNRITLAGAIFLGVIAVLPFLVQNFIMVEGLKLGGTGVLIVVSVVLETYRQIESMTATRSYDSFLR